MGNSYNGYSWEERETNLKVMNRLIANGEVKPALGPCALCGDPDPKAEVEYHGEDYSLPYIWVEPACYVLCRYCHRYKLHQRFARPVSWLVFLAHVRRGGYASDLKDPNIKSEVDAYSKAIRNGQIPVALPALRAYTRVVGDEWFAHLRSDSDSLKDPTARPRP